MNSLDVFELNLNDEKTGIAYKLWHFSQGSWVCLSMNAKWTGTNVRSVHRSETGWKITKLHASLATVSEYMGRL